VGVDCLSRYKETPLHIACLCGNLEVADYLERKGADLGAVDKDGNTVLHYGSSSNSQSLMEWLLRRPGVREKINMKNKVRFKKRVIFRVRTWRQISPQIHDHFKLSPFFFVLLLPCIIVNKR